MATHSSILAWEVPWTEEPDRLQSMELQKSWTRLSDRASVIAQLVKNAPAMQETLVPFLGWEDPLEKGKATHSSFWPEEFVDYIVRGVAKSWT